MTRLVHAIVTGLIGAALLHIIIVLALPRFSESDAYSRILAAGPAGAFHALGDAQRAGPLLQPNPFVSAAVCAFDLSQAPVAVAASGDPALWSFAVFDRASNEVFSISDRSVEPGRLDAVLATPSQAMRLRKADPDLTERSILIEMTGNTGYLVLRTVSPHASMEAEARRFLESARCEALRPG
ncbi:DUF1254 domain-containing protein [Rhizobiaceae bacterium BDR2-2]|uniref:DUF1254 domain-containing protein n=1 Tax=Ectorhizobium quercum TaxID=2965071 RepID=A0AAE3SVT8_9HYPH|nr:DUF1254 domain-containing protein [Ectorhizobium quercum]MCX8998482.1 DUF1254 domain-containing protein [Ectorhizobium quercum]